MNSLKIAYRKLFRKGEHSLTRIISLAAGLAFGILLLSEVFYLFSYDSFYPDADRVYVVCENFRIDKSSDKLVTYSAVSGAVAPGLKAEVPGIESATRLCHLTTSDFYTDDRKSYKGTFVLADEHLFDVIPRPMISGNPGEILKSSMNCMVSSKIAEMMGGDVIGKVIEMKEFPGKELTIAGIFQALPENTNYSYDVLISMVSIGQFMWDGTNNWMGNDRYYACVKLAPGVDPESLAPAVRKMQEVHQDIARLEEIQKGTVLTYTFKPVRKLNLEDNRDMVVLLSTIAFAVLFVSLLNYVLLTLSALVNRAKSSAVHKTCGAQAADLQKMIFSETSLLFIVALSGAFLLILLLKPFAEAQMGHQLLSALTPGVILPLLLILMTVLLLISYLPGRFFARIPVAVAFRNYQQKGNKWKLALLSLQFVGATFILTVLVIVSLQYDKMRNADHGYNVKNVFFASSSGLPSDKILTVIEELRTIPQIETVGLGYCIPTEGAAGNTISLPNDEKELFSIGDFYWIDDNYLSILDISVTEGNTFTREHSAVNDLIISKKGAQMLASYCGWSDGVQGKQVNLSEHGTVTIKGVCNDFVIGSLVSQTTKPAVFSYLPAERFPGLLKAYPSLTCYIMVKTFEGSQKGIMEKIAAVLNTALPHHDAVVRSLEAEQLACYSEEKGFRSAMVAGNIIILLITFMGLLGYTVTEVSRRSKELAIRRINGARLSDILKVFILDLEYIAIPAALAGLVGAWFAASKWMEGFASKIPLHWSIFALCSLSVLVIITAISILNYLVVANKNPVEALRYE